jgi:hypothetical protein
MLGYEGEEVFALSFDEFEQDGKKWKLKEAQVFSDAFGGAGSITIQELEYDPDPLIYHNILVNNPTGSDQTYDLTISLPTTFAAPNVIRGSIDTSLIGPDATVSALLGSSVYTALIDGSGVRTLQDYPFSLTTPQDAVSASESFGPEGNGTAVTSSIGIRLNFTLSPGDTATIISDFEVTPEPGTLVLLGLGALLAFRRRMRA